MTSSSSSSATLTHSHHHHHHRNPIFVAILIFTLLTFYQLSFTFVKFITTNGNLDDASTSVDAISSDRSTRLDSYYQIQNIDNFNANFDLNCNAMLNDNTHRQMSKEWMYETMSDSAILELIDIGGCPDVRKRFGFLHRPMSTEEAQYPIAYAILTESNADQFMRMLSTIYHPQNLYAITYAKAANATFIRVIKSLPKCFDNIVIASENYDMQWCEYSMLESMFGVLRTLVEQNWHRWRYVQYLSDGDLPLKTNLETVHIIKALQGSFNTAVYRNPVRIEERLHLQTFTSPGNLTFFKSDLSATFSRESAEFIVSNALVADVMRYLRNGTICPHESFWTTIAGNPNILPMPGAFPARKMIFDEYQMFTRVGKRSNNYISRYEVWNFDMDSKQFCKDGKYSYGSCIFGVDDLPNLMKRPELFAHKFDLAYQPAAFFCQSESIRRRTIYPIQFNADYYARLAGARYMRMKQKKMQDDNQFDFVEHLYHPYAWYQR